MAWRSIVLRLVGMVNGQLYIYREGLLTKKPSDALHQVAQMSAEHPEQRSIPLEELFMIGVQPEPQERTMTPSKHKHTKEEKFKVSNKCKYELVCPDMHCNSSALVYTGSGIYCKTPLCPLWKGRGMLLCTCQYVGRSPTSCATDNSRTLCLRTFKLGR